MPRFLVPKKTTAHRLAATALFRALLSQCSRLPVSKDNRSTLRDVITNRFRNNRELQSPYQLQQAFGAGYKTLDHFDEAVAGNSQSRDFIESFLRDVPSYIKRQRPAFPFAPNFKPHRPENVCPPPEQSVLNVRPQLSVSGKRRIPKLASTNGIPFLRLKKPQPRSLSRMLRQMIAARNKSLEDKILLNNYWMPLAAYEDQWDELTRPLADVNTPRPEEQWKDTVQSALYRNIEIHDQRLEKDKIMGRKMLQIVEQEKKLAELEKKHATEEEKKKALEEMTAVW